MVIVDDVLVARKQGSIVSVADGCFLTRNENYEVCHGAVFHCKSTAFDRSRQSGRHGNLKSFRSTSIMVGVSQLKLQNLSKNQYTRKKEVTNMKQKLKPANRGINTHELDLPVR